MLTGKYVEKTSSACTITDFARNYISGYYINGTEWTKSRCETECDKYTWCRGIMVKNSDYQVCRLLGDVEKNSMKTTQHWYGEWTQVNKGNWAEPDQWSNSKDAADNDSKCYAKYLTGLLTIRR